MKRKNAVWNDKRRTMGFTLIELLVVVLIIGILAAVALPQYQKAVLNTQFTQLKLLTDTLFKGQEVYHLENSHYATNIEELDIQLPQPLNPNQKGNVRSYSWGKCYIRTTGDSVYCEHDIIGMRYERYYSGSRSCLAYNADLNSPQNQLCKTETRKKTYKNQHIGNPSYTSWFY